MIPVRKPWLIRLENTLCHWHRRLLYQRGNRSRGGGPERVSVILLSYKRPENIDKILSCLALCDFVEEIILSNNNPDVRLERYLHVKDPRLRVINQPERRYASVRFELSLEARSPYLIAIDDDIFPEPEQLRALFDALRTDPRLIHGFGGQIYPDTPPGQYRMLLNRNAAVEALVWIFAYTRAHVDNYFRLLEQMGQANRELRWNEDVPLSFAGSGHARTHYVGKIRRCPSSDQPGVASYREHGFEEHRAALVATMRELTGLSLADLPGSLL